MTHDIITFEIPRSSITGFIFSILGQPRRLEQNYSNLFVIDQEWLLNLDDLITQRISSQNKSQIVDFGAEYYFGNGRKIHLKSHTGFRTFSDISQNISVGVRLTWTYLIDFPEANNPEKQEITFSAFSDETCLSHTGKSTKKLLKSFEIEDNSSLKVKIESTNITWAEDLIGHINRYVDESFKKPSRISEFVKQAFSAFGSTLVLFIGMIGSLTTVITSADTDRASIKLAAKNIALSSNQPAIETLNEKLNVLLNNVAYAEGMKSILIMLGPMLLTIVTAITGALLLKLHFKRFITVNRHSKGIAAAAIRRTKWIYTGLLGACLTSLVTGVLSSWIYARFFGT